LPKSECNLKALQSIEQYKWHGLKFVGLLQAISPHLLFHKNFTSDFGQTFIESDCCT